MAEPTARFAHLLQPLRDLSKVWKIEIAEELEKYIEEVSQLLITNPEDGITQLNFAEAALLIQGSTAIYSRKVELLYQLVYQALDLLVRKDGKKGKTVQNGLWAPIPETEELLTIDHLIKEGRNVLLDQAAPQQRGAEQRRVPLFLMPRDQADRRKTEFRISSCTVHPSGVFLLQASDAVLLEDSALLEMSAEGLDAPLVPAPPSEVQDLDSRLQELLRGLPQPEVPGDAASSSPTADDEAATPTKTGKKEQLETPAKGKTPWTRGAEAMALAGVDVKNGILSAPDPWELLDEHEAVGQDLPLEVGNTSKRVNAKKLLTNADGLPDATTFEGLSDSELWSGVGLAASMAPMLVAGNPIESLFLAVAGHLKVGGRYETQRAGFSAAWLEFEDLFTAAGAKRRQLRSQTKRIDKPAVTPHASDDEASDCEGQEDRAATPARFTTPAKGMGVGMTPLPDQLTEEDMRREEQRKEVAMLESMIEDAQVKYEATIRNHLQAMQKNGEDGPRGFPQLYANVKRWQDQLEPVLKEFESRPDFDIHEYSQKFLTKMASVRGDGEADKAIPFARLVHGQPRWEVCRRFLTCLILTNQGNTDILFDSEEERLNGFRIKLLKAERRMISLDGEDGAQRTPGQAQKRRRKTTADAETTADA